MKKIQTNRQRRHKRVRAKVSGTKERLRLCVFRSAKHIYAQMIDDDKKKTVLSMTDKGMKKSAKEGDVRKGKIALAFEVGKALAKKAEELKIDKAVFDRGGYKYHGRVKALAEGAREGGLKF